MHIFGDRTSWIFFLLFSFGASTPIRKGETWLNLKFVPMTLFVIRCILLPGWQLTKSSGFNCVLCSGQSGSGYTSYGSSKTRPGYSSSSGSYSGVSSKINHGRSFDERLSLMIEDMMHLGPNRVSMESHWNVDHIPLGMIQKPYVVYPSSHVIYSNSGYQRAQETHTDRKYTTETFDDIYVPGVPRDHHDQSETGSHHWPQKTHWGNSSSTVWTVGQIWDLCLFLQFELNLNL